MTVSLEPVLSARARDGGAGSAVVSRSGELIARAGFGLSDRDDGRANTPTTVYDVGSLVKLFTAAAILLLEADGALSTSDVLARFLPPGPRWMDEITVRHLLTHSSGLPDIIDASGRPTDYTDDFDYEPVNRDELVRRAMAARLEFEPGADQQYSNLGYSLLGIIVELATGDPYEAFVRRRLFEPAGMAETGYTAVEWPRERLASGYRDGARWGTTLDRPWLPDGPSWNVRANGGMLSTVDDLHRWTVAMAEGRVLPRAAFDAWLAMHLRTSPRGTRVVGHAGSNGVFEAVILWDLDEALRVVVTTNIAEVPASGVARDLFGAALDAANV